MKKYLAFALALVMALALIPGMALADRPDGHGGNQSGYGEKYGHIDVKVDGKYTVSVDGTSYTLDGSLQANSIKVTIGSTTYDFNNYSVKTQTEVGKREYEIKQTIYPSSIAWISGTFKMSNVYVSARMLFESVPEVLKSALKTTAVDGKNYYYADIENMQYNGVQECTGGRGMRSDGNTGTPTGLDLYITAEAVGVYITKGKLAIEKIIVDENGNKITDNTAFNFTITGPKSYSNSVTVKGGETVTLTDLEAGSYTVTEIQKNGYAICDIDGEATTDYSKDYIVVAKEDSSIPVAQFTNTKLTKKASINIKKTASGAEQGVAYPNPQISIFKADTNGQPVGDALTTVTLQANGDTLYLTKYFELGSYVVVEGDADIADYELKTSLSSTEGNLNGMVFTVSNAGETVSLTVNNAYTKQQPQPEKAKLTIRKEVNGLESGDVLPDDYAVTVKVGETDYVLNKANGYTQTIELDAGTYTVAETTKSDINGYDFVKTEYAGLAEGSIVLAADTEATVTITNSYTQKQPEKANISIYKVVEGVDKPENYEVVVNIKGGDNFDRDITLNASNSFMVNIDVAPGKYTIAEKSSSAIQGYKLVSTEISKTSVELGSNATERIEVTNKYEQLPAGSQLTISKNFRGVYASDLPREFTVYVRPVNAQDNTLGSATAVTLKRDNNYTATIEVESGIYEVTEQSPYLSGYVFTGANYSAESTGENTSGLPNTKGTYVSLGENEPASVAITNSYYYDYTPVTPPPAKPLPPQTGDSGTTAYIGIALCVMAAAAFVAARSRKHS